MVPRFNCRVEIQILAPSLLTWSQKDFSDKFYIVPTSPELTDWLLKAENFVWDLNIFIWWEGSTSYVRVEQGSNSKHILTAVVIFITFWLICCIMSYFFVTAQVPLWTGIQTPFGYPSLQHWMAVIPTTLSSALWPVKAWHHCMNILHTPAQTRYPPHGFQYLNMPQMLTRKIPTFAT